MLIITGNVCFSSSVKKSFVWENSVTYARVHAVEDIFKLKMETVGECKHCSQIFHSHCSHCRICPALFQIFTLFSNDGVKRESNSSVLIRPFDCNFKQQTFSRTQIITSRTTEWLISSGLGFKSTSKNWVSATFLNMSTQTVLEDTAK